MHYCTKNKRAFTLMELMIVIAILGVLTTLMTGNFLTSIKRSRDAQRKNDLSTIQRALEMYYEDNKTYPIATGSPAGDVNFGGKFCHPDELPNLGCDIKTYMQKMPNDPNSGKTYFYSSTSTNNYAIYACLEISQTIVTAYTGAAGFCTPTSCKDKDGVAQRCIWAVSDSNSSP